MTKQQQGYRSDLEEKWLGDGLGRSMRARVEVRLWSEVWLGDGEVMSEVHENLHKRVVNRDHEHLACVLQRGVVDEARHVGAGARRACGSVGSLVSYRHRR